MNWLKNTGTASNHGPWLDAHAAQAWSIRNYQGLMWNIGGTHPPESTRNTFETTSGVAMVNGIYYIVNDQGLIKCSGYSHLWCKRRQRCDTDRNQKSLQEKDQVFKINTAR